MRLGVVELPGSHMIADRPRARSDIIMIATPGLVSGQLERTSCISLMAPYILLALLSFAPLCTFCLAFIQVHRISMRNLNVLHDCTMYNNGHPIEATLSRIPKKGGGAG